MKFTAHTEADLLPVVQHLAMLTQQNKVFAFSGQLGAGKTTLIKQFCKQLGVSENVSSPTFSLVNNYTAPAGTIYHFDFYRLKNEEEAYDIGFEEYLYSNQICLIEWPEMVAGLLPQKMVHINITVSASAERVFAIENA
jgi:tRNA threonylcarbamoyladenosine biosynthesis protein TsaE